MAVTLTYDRPKVATTNATGMVITLLAAEKPNTPHTFRDNAGADETGGNTGQLDCRIQCDANESGAADIQDLFKLETLAAMSAEGVVTLRITVTPVKGDGTLGGPKSFVVIHDENMDIWQSEAGRARQA